MGTDPIESAVLRVQRTAGNRAVARGLRGGGRRLARYESPEHVAIGDRYAKELAEWLPSEEGRAWVERHRLQEDVRGLETDWYALGKRQIGHGSRALTPGQIIALSGDFYETWVDLATAPREELSELITAIHHEEEGQLANPNATYEAITRKHRERSRDHYLELAKRNTPHFTPGNRKQWRKMHCEALELAKRRSLTPGERRFTEAQFSDPGAAHDKAFEQALFIDAAAGHFLTDGFAAGHLFDKDRLEVAITSYLRSNPASPTNPEMGSYYGLVGAVGATPLLVLKNIHDRLNREGIDVSNGRGMRWRTYGDAYLHLAPEAQRIAALAIYVSRRQVYAARAGGDPKPEDVLSLLPDQASVDRATDVARSYIPAAAADIGGLIYRQRSMAPTQFGPILGGIIESNIATIGAPGRERQLLDVQQRAERTRQPQVAPQFTIAEW